MATARQPFLNFPSQTHQGTPAISTSSHLLAALRKSALPTDPPNGLVVLSGHPAVYRLGTCAAVDRALAGEPVLYLAGANVFDPFLVGRLAKAARVAPARVLQQIHVSRAFTCHQMVRLVTDCLPSRPRPVAGLLRGPAASNVRRTGTVGGRTHAHGRPLHVRGDGAGRAGRGRKLSAPGSPPHDERTNGDPVQG